MKDTKKLTALELLQLCLNSDDPDAWNEFVSRFQLIIARVVAKALRRWTTPTPDLVEDLAQDTFVKLFANNCRALREFEFEHENSLFGFLKVVAVRVVHDYVRKEWTDKRGRGFSVVSLDEAISVAGGASPQRVTERRLLIRRINACLAKLSHEPNYDRDRTIFWLFYLFGATAKEIAARPEIGLSIKGVESTLFRLIKFLRQCLPGMP
jgi:RNA polymerase sigma factor (sigma-70 family)